MIIRLLVNPRKPTTLLDALVNFRLVSRQFKAVTEHVASRTFDLRAAEIEFQDAIHLISNRGHYPNDPRARTKVRELELRFILVFSEITLVDGEKWIVFKQQHAWDPPVDKRVHASRCNRIATDGRAFDKKSAMWSTRTPSPMRSRPRRWCRFP